MIHPLAFPKVIDSTILASIRACRRQFELSHLRRYALKGSNVNTHAGAAFARGLEAARLAYYAHKAAPDDAVALGIEALTRAYGDFDSGDSPKSLARMCGALEFYFSEYPLDSDPARIITLGGSPAVEFSFAIPLPILHPDTGEPILFAGRFDAVVEFAGGTYALDEKTTSSLGATWSRQWDMRGQFCGYTWALREHMVEVSGTIVAGVSILKTRYEQQRAIVQQPDWKLKEWYEDTLSDIESMKAHYVLGQKFRKNWSESCNSYGGCQFRQVCLNEDPEPWLETYYHEFEWTPITLVQT